MSIDSIEDKLNDLRTRFDAMGTRQKINLGIIALVGIMLIISVFIFKAAFNKVTVDRSVVEALEKERLQIVEERKALYGQRDSLKVLIQESIDRDNAFVAALNRQQTYIVSINNKLQTLNNAYKKPAEYNDISSDSLSKFFSNLDK